MRKILLLAVITAAFILNTNAQSVKYGAKAGVNFANLVGDDVSDDAKARTSFHVGGVAEIMISDKFSFQPELMFSSQGSMEEIADDGFDEKYTLRSNYLNLPLMAKFYVAEGFSIQAGPQLGFLLSAELESEINGNTTEDDVKDFYKGFDFGVDLGLGYKMSSGLFFDARYNLGMSKVFELDAEGRNSVIQLSVGFLF